MKRTFPVDVNIIPMDIHVCKTCKLPKHDSEYRFNKSSNYRYGSCIECTNKKASKEYFLQIDKWSITNEDRERYKMDFERLTGTKI